jgi:IS30 family transposase
MRVTLYVCIRLLGAKRWYSRRRTAGRLHPTAGQLGAALFTWIDRTSDQDIQEIVLTTNLTPRKCLGFKTPFQALVAELGKDIQIRFS